MQENKSGCFFLNIVYNLLAIFFWDSLWNLR